MLSYLLPIRWQCHTVVSDHTALSISNNTNSYNNHTYIAHPGRIGGNTLYSNAEVETLNLLGIPLSSKLCS